MRTAESIRSSSLKRRLNSYRERSFGSLVLSSTLASIAAVGVFYFSLVATSAPVQPREMVSVERAIDILDAKGFDREVFLLRHTATFRSSDNWLNRLIFQENSYAATNSPFQIITLHSDFYTKAEDDTERAMILLHEVQHLQMKGEADAYTFVWQNRERLGWTQLSHGTTPTYITIADQTRENSPELFTCTSKVWNDCTESLQAHK